MQPQTVKNAAKLIYEEGWWIFLLEKIIAIIIILAILLLISLFICTVVRCKKSRKKVKGMCNSHKNRLLNELSEPFGFCYIPPNPDRGTLATRPDMTLYVDRVVLAGPLAAA